MRKKWMVMLLISVLAFTAAACGRNESSIIDNAGGRGEEQEKGDISGQKYGSEADEDITSVGTLMEENGETAGIQPEDNNDSRILIAYFSRVGNTDFPEGVDAISSASLILEDGEIYGNTQYIASLIG